MTWENPLGTPSQSPTGLQGHTHGGTGCAEFLVEAGDEVAFSLRDSIGTELLGEVPDTGSICLCEHCSEFGIPGCGFCLFVESIIKGNRANYSNREPLPCTEATVLSSLHSIYYVYVALL